jgi:uncharacterized membrane protein
MRKRPLAITILSCLFIAIGIIGFAHHLSEIKASQPFQSDVVWALASGLAAIVCGAFMLRGNNWARWLALAWIAFHVVLSIFHSLQQVLVHSLLFLLFAYVLFRPEARAYFRQRETTGA